MLWIIVLCLVLVCIYILVLLKKQKEHLHAIGEIAHDLGNACSIMEQAASLCAMGKASEYSDLLRGQGRYAVLLCRILCNLCAGQSLVIDRRLGDMGEYISSICGQMTAWLRSREIDLQVETVGNCMARFDAAALQRIFCNLVSNAAEAMPEGGAIFVTVDGASDPSRVSVSVEDTGTGMDEKTCRRIFRRHVTKKAERGAHGLGLPAALRLAKLHSGSITVRSQLGKGSCFCLTVRR